jgi:hypothetical protein
MRRVCGGGSSADISEKFLISLAFHWHTGCIGRLKQEMHTKGQLYRLGVAVGIMKAGLPSENQTFFVEAQPQYSCCQENFTKKGNGARH